MGSDAFLTVGASPVAVMLHWSFIQEYAYLVAEAMKKKLACTGGFALGENQGV